MSALDDFQARQRELDREGPNRTLRPLVLVGFLIVVLGVYATLRIMP